MTLESIYYVGQTAAVLVIFGSLLAIYFQMDQQNRMSRFNSTKDLLAQFNSLTMVACTDAELRKLLKTTDPLTDDEIDQLDFYTSMFCNIWVALQLGFDNGQIDENSYNAGAKGVGDALARWPQFKIGIRNYLDRYPEMRTLAVFKPALVD